MLCYVVLCGVAPCVMFEQAVVGLCLVLRNLALQPHVADAVMQQGHLDRMLAAWRSVPKETPARGGIIGVIAVLAAVSPTVRDSMQTRFGSALMVLRTMERSPPGLLDGKTTTLATVGAWRGRDL